MVQLILCFAVAFDPLDFTSIRHQSIVLPMTSTPTEEKTWPVLLYRRERDGWKKQEFASSSSSSSSSWRSSTRKNRHYPGFTTAAPREGCIVFPALRQRFSLRSETDQGTVIRRDDKILLVSKRRARALLLRFRSLEDCLQFSDLFVRLNPRPSTTSSIPSSARKEDAIANARGSRQENDGSEEGLVVGESIHKEVVSWVVKLLHDKCFLTYAQKIEQYIAETEDGMQILLGLGERDFSSSI